MKHFLPILSTLALAFLIGFAAEAQVLNPNDPVITYDSDNPPQRPAWGQVGKWVRTKKVNWNTDDYKAYIYKNINFRLKFPKNYDPNTNKTYPMILMLHGLGESGDIYDNEKQLVHGAKDHLSAINNGSFDGFALFPQSYGSWSDAERAEVRELVNYMIDNSNVDPFRINIHGLSNGGKAVWAFFIENTNLIASALPMSATSSERSSTVINRIKYSPIWQSQGGLDKNPTPSGSEVLVDLINSYGGNIRYTLYPDLGHGVWYTHYRESDFYPFLTRANKVNPWPLFEQKEFCPGDPINVKLGVTPGFQGYEWRKDGTVIAGANSHELQVTTLGTYDVRVKRNGVWSYWSPEPVIIKIKAPTQTPPIKLAAAHSQAIPSPDGRNYTVLELPEGFEAYTWRKVGSNTVVGSERTLRVTAPGEYVATVTEKFGCASNASAPIRVIDANGSNAPAPATGLSATMLSKTQINLTWSQDASAPYNESGFEIYRSTQAGGSYSLTHVTAANALSYTDVGLNANTKYFYIVRAINQNGAAPASNEASATTDRDANPPSTPSNLVVTSSTTTSATLSWGSSTDDVGIDKYIIYRDGTQILTTTNTEITAYGLSEGQLYRFTVKARDISGNLSAASNQVTVSTEKTGLVYAYYEGQFSNLPDFNALTSVKTGMVDNFTLDPRNQNDNFAFKFEGTIKIPTTGEYTFYTSSDDGSKLYIGGYGQSYQVVNNDGLHGYRERNGKITLTAGSHPIVVTFFERGGGERLDVRWAGPGISKQLIPTAALKSDSNLPSLPTAPSQLSANAVSYNKINLSWTDNSVNETGFQIYRAANAGGPFSPVVLVGENTVAYSDTKVAESTTYYYRVQATNQAGKSDFSNTVSATTPSAPVVVPEKLFTSRVNFTKNTTASSPWFNTSKDPAVGDTFSNLPDENGAGTGVNIKLLSAWGGSYNAGASTGNNSGVVPDAALKEYYWFGTFGAPNTVDIELSGLDPTMTYSFKFVASSVFNMAGITDNGTTVFTIGGRSASVYVQNNTTEFALIDQYQPSANGKAVVTLSKQAGTPVGYLNAIIIEGYANPDAPGGPASAEVTAYGISKNQIKVNWTDIPSATSYELYRSSTVSGSYAKIYSGTSTSYTHSGLAAATTYYYKVKTIYADGVSESEPVPGATLQYLVYMNMNADTRYDAPAPWNNFGILPSDNDTFGNFKNDQGGNTGLVLEFEESLTGGNDWGISTGNNSGIYPDNVMKSFFFMETFDNAELVMKGLDQSMRYNFVFFNSINVNFSVTTDFTIGNQTVVAEATGNTTTNKIIRGVSPDINGEVRISITSNENWSIFNAMVVEAYPNEGGINARTTTSDKPVSYTKEVYQLSSDALSSSDINVYPNPFQNVLQINVPDANSPRVEVTLTDMLGRTVYSKLYEGARTTVDLSDATIKSGVYLLKVDSDVGTKVFRMLKE